MKILSRSSRIFVLSFLLLVSSSPLALAHDPVMFEFAPDPWDSQRFNAATAGGPIYEVFESPTSAPLSGIDLWLDNPGSSGQITLTLFNSTQQQLGSVTANLPTISTLAGGTKTHFDFANPPQLQYGQ